MQICSYVIYTNILCIYVYAHLFTYTLAKVHICK